MRVLLTGGNSGIGEATVRRLIADGHHVVFTFCRNPDKARVVADATGAEPRHYDQASAESVAELADVVRAGEFQALVNNASQPAERRLLLKTDVEAFLAYQMVALRGLFVLSRTFAEQVKQRGGAGAIVNVLTSYTLGMPPAKLAAYCTSKHALLGLTRSMAVEFIRYGVRVNAVAPGMTRTDFIGDLPAAFIEQVEQGLPMGRLATALEVAGVIRFLLSPDAAYVNGANLPITGGQEC
ncbi:MAG TPA: SDR family oxidoreductase [Candidatus Binatia bacterium]|nr:SDR family oxidoreductase [Candidatus Binatia bacterium]